MTGPRLFTPPRARRGRNERATDTVAGALRRLGAYDEIARARITLARTLAASLDRLEHDDDRAEYTLGSVGRVYRDVLADVATPFATDRSLDDLLAALDPPTDADRDPDQRAADPRHPPQS